MIGKKYSWLKLRGRIIVLTIIAGFSLLLLDTLGTIEKLYETDYHTSFSYPYEGDVIEYVNQLRHGQQPDFDPINVYKEKFLNTEKCKENGFITIIVKSSPENFERRQEIRKTWGYEDRFPGTKISTLFLIGVIDDVKMMKSLDVEIRVFKDIVHLDLIENNPTLKTINALRWASTYCNDSKFYAFFDENAYVSVKNLLKFLQNPYTYPNNVNNGITTPRTLYAGNVEYLYPRRDKTSQFYVPIGEYPFDEYPPVISAKCFILSKEALQLMYFTSLYTKLFRFDSLFLGFVAHKAGIRMVHSNHFYVNTDAKNLDFKHVIAFIGFAEPFQVWKNQLIAHNV